MVSFIIYDLIFLVLFTLAVVVFLYKKRHNLQRQGLLYLYRTKLGIKFIEWATNKFRKTLSVLQYVVILSGYILMIGMVYLFFKFSYFYLTSPIAAEQLKVPVIVPLVPYLPEIFNLDFLPPFYFTYWIIIIAIIAIPHEFAHGIFARLAKIKIHSTGFGFLGPFLAAFVEPDEKDMEKRSKKAQLAILAAGTFANIIVSIILALLFFAFFVSSFSPAGVIFNTYASTTDNLSQINAVNGVIITDTSEIPNIINKSSSFTEVKLKGDNLSRFVQTSFLITAVENNIEEIPVVIDSPAFRARLSGAISEIDGKKITSLNELTGTLQEYKAGDKIKIKTIKDSGEKEYEIELAEFEGRTFLGIGVIKPEARGVLGWLYKLIEKIKDPFIYYKSSLGNLGLFVYHLIWWSLLISISVALVNMLPLGIFDGGRFFYLTVAGITGSKSIGAKAFKLSTYILSLTILALMVRWLFIFV